MAAVSGSLTELETLLFHDYHAASPATFDNMLPQSSFLLHKVRRRMHAFQSGSVKRNPWLICCVKVIADRSLCAVR